jgi:hypothetical protein
VASVSIRTATPNIRNLLFIDLVSLLQLDLLLRSAEKFGSI